MQRIIWFAIVSLFASTILDRITTILGLSAGFVETNPVQSWIIAHFPVFFYTSAIIFPATISLIFTSGLRILSAPNLRLQRQILAFFFVGLSVYSWTPVVSNMLLLRGAI